MSIRRDATTKLPMACSCDPEDREKLLADRQKVIEIMGVDLTNEDVAPFVSQLIAWLWHEYQYTCEGIYSDMWFGVKLSGPENKGFWIECDTVEDGLTQVFLHLHQEQDQDAAT
jgi:hypothetical protein